MNVLYTECMKWPVLVFFLFTTAAANAMAEPALFESHESFSSSVSAFPKWTKVIGRQPSSFQKMQAQCSAGGGCVRNKWESLIAELRSAPEDKKIREVNRFMNEHPYIEDIQNWGVGDYWAILYEFLTRNGDCEDYALSKYFTLKRLGFSDNDMRIVVLKDNNLGVMHSVLAVYQGDTIYILDNQFTSVVEHTKILHYQPIYSINQRGWWRHRTS